MTSIDKLQIRGIRSFSPVDHQTLQFQKPLTLIVGKNGSGKTTIIECLKMGCTGELPPNCKNGQAFIHDPKILAKQEIKAQIKLKFFGLTAHPVVCTRSFSLTQKATKMEYKAFEAALQTVDDSGSRQTLSYKCADLNRLVPELMGVSPAVLENVIFVHQEESCWPLSDDATLKKKFDDIFAATQYTKALEEIRKFKNQKKQEEKNLGLELATLEEQLGTANKLREELAAASETSAKLKEVIRARQQEIDDANAKLPALQRTFSDRNRIRAEIGTLQTKLGEARNAWGEKKRQLTEVYQSELADTNEELEKTLNTTGQHIARAEEQMRQKASQLQQYERDKERDQQRMYDANSRFEAAKAQREQHRAAEQEAERQLGGLEGRHVGMQLGASRDTTLRVASGLEALKGLRQARADDLSKAKAAAHEKVGALMATTQEAKVKVEGAGAEIDKKQREARELQKKEQALSEKLSEMEADEIRLNRLKEQVRKAKEEQETQTQDGTGQSEAAQLAADKKKLSGLNHQFNDLVEEHQKVDAEHDKQQAYAKLKATVAEQKEKLDKAIDDKKGKISRVLKTSASILQMLEDNQLVKKFSEAKRTAEAERESQAQQVASAQGRLNKKENEVTSKGEEVSRQKAELEEKEDEVRKGDPAWLTPGFDFAARVAEAEREAEEARSAGSDQNEVFATFMTDLIGVAERKKQCGVCKQQCGEEQIEHMRKRQRKFQETASVSPEEKQERIRQKSELARNLRRAEEVMRRVKKLKTIDLPASEQSRDELRTEQNQLRGDLDNERRTLEELEAQEREVSDLKTDVEMLRLWHTEYSKTKYEVDTSQSGMQSSMYGGVQRTKAEVSEDMSKVTEQRNTLQKKIERLEGSLRDLDVRRQEVQRKRNQAELELSQLQAQLERKQDLEAQRQESERSRLALQAEATTLRQQEEPMRAELRRLEEQLLQERASTEREVARHDSALAEVNRDLDQLQTAHDRLRSYTQAGHAAALAEAEGQFETAKGAVQRNEAQMLELREAIDKLRANSQSKDGIKLEIQANLEYRRLKEKNDELDAAIKAKEAEMAALPNADSVDREIREIEKRVSAFKLEIAQANGSLDTVESRVKNTKKDLQNEKYRKVDDEHRKKLVECKTTHLAVKDLDNYYKALDRALMKFHSSKMESINKSIKELWNRTYKGPDIDGIEIHSEHEGETAAGARKQSYRVIMTKGDTRLDMRGRCSAGQKVLASLVIRLALAESFCINCGILALDEPTTNLDTANIESFAQAINEIVKARKQQANFQLIVITHDEEFVQMIGRTDNCSHYFRVDKRLADNSNHNAAPHSVIDRFEIGRFG